MGPKPKRVLCLGLNVLYHHLKIVNNFTFEFVCCNRSQKGNSWSRGSQAVLLVCSLDSHCLPPSMEKVSIAHPCSTTPHLAISPTPCLCPATAAALCLLQGPERECGRAQIGQAPCSIPGQTWQGLCSPRAGSVSAHSVGH